MASMVPCKKNTAGYIFYVGLVSQANGNLLQVNPTLSAGDVKIAIDDGAPANLATLPAVDADFTKRVKVVLSQAETNGDNLSIIFCDAAGSEWCDQIVTIQTVANQIDDIATELAKVPKSDSTVTFNATALASIQASADAALVANKLDHLVLTADADDVADNSIIAKLATKASTANWSDFVPQTDSLEAIRDRGDQAWLTGAAAAADLSYNPTSVTKVVGGTLAGDHTNLAVVNASYCSLQETTTTTFLELNVGFSSMLLTAHPAALRVWAYYSGSQSHYLRVQAYNYVSAGWEDVGTIPNGAAVAAYVFSLSPNHIDHVNGVASIKFLHSASSSGINTHYLYLDKVEFDAATPIASDYATSADLALVKAVTDALTAAAATKLAISAGTIVSAAAAAGTLSTTQMTTTLTELTSSHYIGRVVIWTSGVLQNQASPITAYDGGSKLLTFTAVTEAPTAGDTFIIV